MIHTILELRLHANLPCLGNLALSDQIPINMMHILSMTSMQDVVLFYIL